MMNQRHKMSHRRPGVVASTVTFDGVLICFLFITLMAGLNGVIKEVESLDNSYTKCQETPFITYPFCNSSLPANERVRDLLSRLSLDEKITMIGTSTPGIPEFGISAYGWWSEALHGVVSSSHTSTSFPEPIGLGATFNTSLYRSIGSTISTEARALNNLNQTFSPGIGQVGLTFFTPNINIFRDPRWGRGQETPGEDPFLTSQYVSNLVPALQQGDDPRYLKVISTCKHYAAYSLEDWNGMDRYHFNAVVTLSDLIETYLPAFEACIEIGKARSVMCSYNAVNGAPSCANEFLLSTSLRGEFNFSGYVVGDCGAVSCIQYTHNYTNTTQDTCKVAITAGTDLDCGSFYQQNMANAVSLGSVSEEQLDVSVGRLFEHQMLLGMFDPPELVTYRSLGEESINTPAAQSLALEAARQSIVLLKNEGNVLPLDLSTISTIAVIGPNANDPTTLLGNYYGTPPFIVTPLMALSELPGVTVLYATGCEILGNDTSGFDEAIQAATKADVSLVFIGINQTVESEGNDRYTLNLPGVQLELIQQVNSVSKLTIVIYINGGPVGDPWVKDNIPGIIEAWYGGQSAGTAIVDVLTGVYNPDGRLPVTIYYNNFTQEISMENMNMTQYPGRTYRYLQVPTLWEFGFGLSYTTWDVTWVNDVDASDVIVDDDGDAVRVVDIDSLGGPIDFSAIVKNTGEIAGSYSVLAFFTPPTGVPTPLNRQLFDFHKVALAPGEETQVYFYIPPVALALANELGEEILHPGRYEISVDGVSTYLELRGEGPKPLPKHLHTSSLLV